MTQPERSAIPAPVGPGPTWVYRPAR
ncbi:unnamed protein product [Spirodela intermedia]|uniref:Uncharacterized protein n=1 Tax=Spirodela intermedia TaxID=51605 RepID=A0A7I8LE10_SPIIN|nr:unnamed protein product [Spirodela intermedia]